MKSFKKTYCKLVKNHPAKSLLLGGLALVVLGSVWAAFSISPHADTATTASFQAEAGTKTGNVTQIADANAAGGSAIKFNAPSTGGSCTGAPNTPGGPDPWGGCWPGPGNVGHTAAPGYPGSLTDFTGTLQSNSTVSFRRFQPGFTIPANITNITFYGCQFLGADSSVWNVRVDGKNVTFDYSSFVPRDQAAPPVSHTGSSQFGIWHYYDNPGKLTVTNSEFWGWANGIMYYSRAGAEYTFTARNNYLHDARADGGGVDHTDGILQHDAFAQNSVIDHNVIMSEGNTNGIALQEQQAADIVMSKNLLSGFGYTVAIAKQSMTNVQFVDNVFTTKYKPMWGPLYSWPSGTNNVWRRNTWHIAPGGYSSATADNGKYWWPNGTLSTTDYAGQ